MASSAKFIGKDGWKGFKKTLAKLDGAEVTVGVPGEVDFSGPNTAAIGMVHEFGSADGTIPERSFIRSTFDINESKYRKLMEGLIKKATKAGKFRVHTLFQLGETARADIVKRIVGKEIPQDPRGLGNKPDGTALVETGNLIGSIVSTVRRSSK